MRAAVPRDPAVRRMEERDWVLGDLGPAYELPSSAEHGWRLPAHSAGPTEYLVQFTQVYTQTRHDNNKTKPDVFRDIFG